MLERNILELANRIHEIEVAMFVACQILYSPEDLIFPNKPLSTKDPSCVQYVYTLSPKPQTSCTCLNQGDDVGDVGGVDENFREGLNLSSMIPKFINLSKL